MSRSLSLASVRRLLVVALSIGVLGSAVVSQAASPIAAVNTTDGIALKGYDPVAYFTAGTPTPGVEQYSYRWQGVTYRFASAENRQRFTAAPTSYLPQYGGYCAYAMSLNLIADINPVRWAVVEGKLYLNNSWFSHTLWSAHKDGSIAKADGNWAVWPKTEVVQ